MGKDGMVRCLVVRMLKLHSGFAQDPFLREVELPLVLPAFRHFFCSWPYRQAGVQGRGKQAAVTELHDVLSAALSTITLFISHRQLCEVGIFSTYDICGGLKKNL